MKTTTGFLSLLTLAIPRATVVPLFLFGWAVENAGGQPAPFPIPEPRDPPPGDVAEPPPPEVTPPAAEQGATRAAQPGVMPSQLHIPPGHLPPPGSCRIWFPDRPPGRQPPPGDCAELAQRVPAGALLLSRPDKAEHVRVTVFDPRQPGTAVATRVYDPRTGRYVDEFGERVGRGKGRGDERKGPPPHAPAHGRRAQERGDKPPAATPAPAGAVSGERDLEPVDTERYEKRDKDEDSDGDKGKPGKGRGKDRDRKPDKE